MSASRILFLTAFAPYPTATGDRQRSNFLYRALSKVAPTDTLLVALYTPTYPEQLERLKKDYSLVGELFPTPDSARGVFGSLGPVQPKLISRFDRALRQLFGGEYAVDPRLASGLADALAKQKYDVIVGRYIRTTVQSGALASTPVVIDVDDYEVYRDRLASPRLRGPMRWLTHRHHKTVNRIVPERVAAASHLWLSAARDVPDVPHPHVSPLANLAFFSDGDGHLERLPPSRESQIILTVGNLKAPMNVNGLDRFVSTVWPTIRLGAPKARFRIVGGAMSDAMRARWGKVAGVEPVGFVEDLREEYLQCAFTASPIYEGGGTKIKVLESLNRGRTVALTQHSLRGYEHALQHGKDVWVAQSDAALADGCIRLLGSPDLRDALAAHGAAQATQFSFANFCDEVKITIDRVTSDGAGVRLQNDRDSNLKS
jgi:hypothetical protein